MPNYDNQMVRTVFRGWREEYATANKVRVTEFDGAFPSVNETGITARLGRQPNHAYMKAKELYGLMQLALLTEPNGSEFEFIKPGTQSVRCIMPIERDGELAQDCGFILVEGKCYWPTRQERDQNNYAALIFKIVPDVLERGGFLHKHDDWLSLQCGNLGRGWNTKMPAYTEIMFFPSSDRLVLVDEAQT